MRQDAEQAAGKRVAMKWPEENIAPDVGSLCRVDDGTGSLLERWATSRDSREQSRVHQSGAEPHANP
jgi:hypothetical protein